MTTVEQLIPDNVLGAIAIDDDIKYYGSKHFFLRENLCEETLKERVDEQYPKEIPENFLSMFKDEEYLKEEVVSSCATYVTFSNGYHLATHFYDYFSGLKLDFRFTKEKFKPIGLFKDDEWVGVVMPIKLNKDKEGANK